jgi:hypothetical protein
MSPTGDQSSAHWRREVWKSYYETLSNILQRRMIYTQQSGNPESEFHESLDSLSEQGYLNARTQQRAELKRVEWVYETILLKETRFPKASQSNEEMEKWIELAVKNWRVFCGPNWEEEALGEETKATVGAHVLEVGQFLCSRQHRSLADTGDRFSTALRPRPTIRHRSYDIFSWSIRPSPSLISPSRPSTHTWTS